VIVQRSEHQQAVLADRDLGAGLRSHLVAEAVDLLQGFR
jgi:hypothetical protein